MTKEITNEMLMARIQSLEDKLDLLLNKQPPTKSEVAYYEKYIAYLKNLDSDAILADLGSKCFSLNYAYKSAKIKILKQIEITLKFLFEFKPHIFVLIKAEGDTGLVKLVFFGSFFSDNNLSVIYLSTDKSLPTHNAFKKFDLTELDKHLFGKCFENNPLIQDKIVTKKHQLVYDLDLPMRLITDRDNKSGNESGDDYVSLNIANYHVG